MGQGLIKQGSKKWKKQRRGKITGTRIHPVIVEGKGADNVFQQILDEIQTGIIIEIPDNIYMQHGRTTEPIAANWYEIATGQPVEEVEFVAHPAPEFNKWCGASPDRKLIHKNKYIEIKCPATNSHKKFLKTGNIPANYQSQMLLQMAVSPGIESIDFVSFDDRKENYADIDYYEPIKIVNFPRDPERIESMEEKLRKFILRLKKEL